MSYASFGVPYLVVLTYAQALDILKEKAGIDAGYWLGKSSIDPYFDELIIKIAAAFMSQGTVP